MDMGNIVLHMLDQVGLVPSLVPKYVQCCQHTCQNGYSLAKKVQTHIFPRLNPHLACLNAKNCPHAMRSWQPCNQYVWRYLQHTCVRDNERMRKLFCRNEGNFTTLNPCGRWEPSLMMRPGCIFFFDEEFIIGTCGSSKGGKFNKSTEYESVLGKELDFLLF